MYEQISVLEEKKESNLQPISSLLNDTLTNEVETDLEPEQIEDLEKIDLTPINIKQNEIILKLGDIIVFSDPTNEKLNDNVFIIDYIDNSKIKLINSETFDKVTLPISSSGLIGDGSIKNIKVISSNENEGYARQNNLLPGTWVNIYFGGDIPIIITGEIINIEEDMIEIKTIDKDILYINFNYQGIPEELPIETFEIRPPPSKEVGVEELVKIGEREEREEENQDSDFEFEDLNEHGFQLPKKLVKDKIQKLIFDTSEIEFGDIINIKEYVNIDKEKYRFNIESQTNDMLEEMISSIPNYKRTERVLNNIHIMISRFIQLREISSKFDENHNVIDKIEKTAEDRPLIDYLSNINNNLYWILLVASNIKKVYENDKKNKGILEEEKNSDEVECVGCSKLDSKSLMVQTNEGGKSFSTCTDCWT
jgi:hypothetical protein